MSSISTVNNSTEITPFNKQGRLDPYNIFQLNFAALGGEKNVKEDSTFLYQGQLQMDGYAFDIQEYIKYPLKSLRIVSSNAKILYKYGDDGVNLWADQGNGQINKVYDANSPEREVQKMWEEYAYTDPKNRFFTAQATRKVNINGEPCYEIKIRNRKTDEVVTQYYSQKSYLLQREIKENSAERVQRDFSDYQAVGKTLKSHKIDLTYLDTFKNQTITWNKISSGLFISDSKFYPPSNEKEPDDFSNLTGLGTKLNTLI